MGCGASKKNIEDPTTPPSSASKGHELGTSNSATPPTHKRSLASNKQAHSTDWPSALDKLDELIGQLENAWVPEALEPLMSLLAKSGDGISFALGMVIPPPAGQAVGVVVNMIRLAATAMANKRLCCCLAQQAARCVKTLAHNHEQLVARSSELKNTLTEFKAVVCEIETYVAQFSESGWLARMLSWGTVTRECDELSKQLDSLMQQLKTDLGIQTYLEVGKIADHLDKMAEVDQRLVDDLNTAISTSGGVDGLLSSPDQLQTIVGRLGAGDQLTIGTLQSLRGELQGYKADLDLGPHKVVQHKALRVFWRNYFHNFTKVRWKDFWDFFPGHLQDDTVSSQSHSELEDMFCGDKEEARRNRELFHQAVEIHDLDDINVIELAQAFKADDDLLKKAQELVKVALGMEKRGKHTCSWPAPPVQHFMGREAELQAVAEFLESDTRILVIYGSPGLGKAQIAYKAGADALARGLLPGGGYRVNLVDNTPSGPDAVVSRLCDAFKAGSAVMQAGAADEAALRMQLAALADGSSGRALLLLDHADALFDNTAMKQAFEQLCERLLLPVAPDLKIVVACQRNPTLSGISYPMTRMQVVDGLSAEASAALIKAICKDVNVDAHIVAAIARRASHVPLLLCLTGQAINSGLLQAETVAHAEAATVDKSVADHVQRSLAALAYPPYQKGIIALSLFAGTFDKDAAMKVLGVPGRTVKAMLEELQDKHLVRRSADPRRANQDIYQVEVVVREACRRIIREGDRRLDELGLKYDEFVPQAAHRYVQYCHDVLADNTGSTYMSSATYAFYVAETSKADVQQALGLSSMVEELTDPTGHPSSALDLYAEMLRMMPYVNVYDASAVTTAAMELLSSFRDADHMLGQAACLLLTAAMCSGDGDSMTTALSQAFTVQSLLEEHASDMAAKAQMRIAAARVAGCLYRDLSRYDESAVTLRDACAAAQQAAAGAEKPPGDGIGRRCGAAACTHVLLKLESVLTKAELAGTLDYQQTDEANAEGKRLAEELVATARGMFNAAGSDAPHPVLATCLTYLGFFLKGSRPQAQHEAATRVHEEALTIRVAVYGEEHVDVAQSYNQLGISLMELPNKLTEAEEVLHKALKIRIKALGADNPMVANTRVQLAALHVKQGCLGAAEQELRAAIEVRRAKKLLPKVAQALRQLEAVVRQQQGREGEADALAAEAASVSG